MPHLRKNEYRLQYNQFTMWGHVAKYKKDGVAVSIDKWDSNDRTKARLMREVLSGNNKFPGKIKSIKSKDGRDKNLRQIIRRMKEQTVRPGEAIQLPRGGFFSYAGKLPAQLFPDVGMYGSSSFASPDTLTLPVCRESVRIRIPNNSGTVRS